MYFIWENNEQRDKIMNFNIVIKIYNMLCKYNLVFLFEILKTINI